MEKSQCEQTQKRKMQNGSLKKKNLNKKCYLQNLFTELFLLLRYNKQGS